MEAVVKVEISAATVAIKAAVLVFIIDVASVMAAVLLSPAQAGKHTLPELTGIRPLTGVAAAFTFVLRWYGTLPHQTAGKATSHAG